MAALVSDLPLPVRKLVPADFTRLATDTRDYFSHWEPSLEAKAAKDEKLIALAAAVKLLFDLTMMRELGFKQKPIAAATLSNNQRLVSAVQRGFLAL